jgi:peptidoglycan/LPS O-acetylase OafA/YrhL
MQIKQRLDALTSLRFVAAAMIVLSHAHPLFGSFGIANAAPMGQGVSFFFVLSGFILTYNYPSLPDKAAIQHFWLARFARVWPLHAVMCLLWIAVLFDFDRQQFFPGVWGMIKLGANLLLLQSWVPLKEWSLSFNGVAWSLSVEAFFYLCFPLLIAAWRRHWHWLFATQGLMILCFLLVGNYFALPAEDSYDGIGLLGLVYFNPLVRLFEFTVGILVAKFVLEKRADTVTLTVSQWLFLEIAVLAPAVIGMLAAANFVGIGQTIGKSFAYYFTRDGLWLFWALLIGVFALSQGPIARALSARVPVFLGEISFALYLCHALLIHYLTPYADTIARFGWRGALLWWVAVLTLSALLFIGVEKPMRQWILSLPAARKTGVKGARLWSRPSWSTGAAVALIVGYAVSLSVFRPSTINPLTEIEVQAFLHSPRAIVVANGANFGGRYALLGIEITPIPSSSVRATGTESVTLRALLRSEQRMVASDVLAVHLNDENQKIFNAPGDAVLDKVNRELPKGTYWIAEYVIGRAQFERARSIGLAMYRDPSVLFPVTATSTDWAGKRLIISK